MVSAVGRVVYKIWLIAGVSVLALVVLGTVLLLIKERKNKCSLKKTSYAACAVSILIFALSWVLNYGTVRLTLSFVMMPFIYTLILFLYNILIAQYVDKSKKLSILNGAFFITFVLANVFMPDKGDIATKYLFFGLVKGYKTARIATVVSIIMIIAHAVLFIWQIVEVSLIKKKVKALSKSDRKDESLKGTEEYTDEK